MEDLSIAGSDASSSSDIEPERSALPETSTSATNAASPPSPVISKQKRKSHKPTFKSWAKNLLCQAETLDLREGVLPYNLEKDYRMSIVPKGKRCLCATTNDTGQSLPQYSTSLVTETVFEREYSWEEYDPIQSSCWVSQTFSFAINRFHCADGFPP